MIGPVPGSIGVGKGFALTRYNSKTTLLNERVFKNRLIALSFSFIAVSPVTMARQALKLKAYVLAEINKVCKQFCSEDSPDTLVKCLT